MKKILIVDDEPNIVMTLEYTFKKNNPDIIILDVMMPNVDGFETLKKIKANSKLIHCKVIFLSAKNRPSDIEKGLEIGADLYLTKPFSIKKVLEEVQQLFAQ